MSFLALLFGCSYGPTVFILKPGQCLHINKGRLHSFRKLEKKELREADCFKDLREKYVHEHNQPLNNICLSVAWDWFFQGKTANGAKNEINYAFESSEVHKWTGRADRAPGMPSQLLMAAGKALTTKKLEDMSEWDKAVLEMCMKEKQNEAQLLRSVKEIQIASGDETFQGNAHPLTLLPNSLEGTDMDPFCDICNRGLGNAYFHCVRCRAKEVVHLVCHKCYICEVSKGRLVEYSDQRLKDNHTRNTGKGRNKRVTPIKENPQDYRLRFSHTDEQASLNDKIGVSCNANASQKKRKIISVSSDED